MSRAQRTLLLVLLLHGATAWWSRAAAQGGFQVRHDAYGWGYLSFGFSVEQNAGGDILVFSNNDYLDTTTNLYWSSIVGASRFSADGTFLSEDTLWRPQRATYVGWSNCSTLLSDGRVLVSGATFQNGDTNRTALYWFGQYGELLDHREFLPSSRSWITYQHKNTPDGGFILTGVTSATGIQDIFLLKTDSVGNAQWWQTYGHPTRGDYATSVALAPDGGFYIGASYPQTATKNVQWLLHTDSIGALLWEHFPGALQDVDYAYSEYVLATVDGEVICASGLYSGGNDQQTWPQLVKLDTAGNELWNRHYGVAFYGTGFFSVAEVSGNHDLIACGQRYYVNNLNIPYSKGLLLRANSEGDSLWMREYAYYDSTVTDCEGTLRDVQPTPDGGFVAVGETRGNSNGNNPPGLSVDVWVVKVDSMGCLVPGCDDFSTAITVQATNLKDALSVYPNPAHGGTMAKVTLPAGSPFANDLRLRLVSAQGQEVLVQKAALGENQVPLRGLAAGVFYLHLTSGSTWLSGTKLIVE